MAEHEVVPGALRDEAEARQPVERDDARGQAADVANDRPGGARAHPREDAWRVANSSARGR
jgi:hypothetical protein